MKKLTDYYQKAKKQANGKSGMKFFSNLEEHYRNAIVTNVDSATSYECGEIVNFCPKTIQNDTYGTIFHEFGHFLDFENRYGAIH